MADACAVASYRQLAWTAGWHLREETYRHALAAVVNAHQRHPLAALFGAADVSSSDGQHFPTGGPGEAVGAVNARYGRDASALFYTHLTARHAPFHTVAIPPAGEAAHVIDGLLYHEADLSIASTTPTAAASAITSSLSRICWVLRLRRASRTWPSDGFTPSDRRAIGRR